MQDNIQKVEKYIDKAKNILAVSHYGPDEDAISSLLAVFSFLKQKNKKVSLLIEDQIPQKYDFLENFDQLKSGNILKTLKEENIDLLIICDAYQYHRVSLYEFKELENYLKESKLRTICIDHHQREANAASYDIYINWQYFSTAETLYDLFIKKLKYK
jgi:phosphoesterase RecJ-like protein